MCMTKKYIYLAGPIAQCTQGEANDWRDYLSEQFHSNIIGISPLRCETMHGETYGPGNDPRYNSQEQFLQRIGTILKRVI